MPIRKLLCCRLSRRWCDLYIPASAPSHFLARFLPAFLPVMLLCACGRGGGWLSSVGPVILEDGTDRFSDGGAEGPLSSPDVPRQEGTPSPGIVPDPSYYETAEYYAGQWQAPLEVTRFSDAYARGWTGAGSLVTVADTGVDSDHPDLASRLAHIRDFTGSGIEDTNGHGTHVAGIIAARCDGVGAATLGDQGAQRVMYSG